MSPSPLWTPTRRKRYILDWPAFPLPCRAWRGGARQDEERVIHVAGKEERDKCFNMTVKLEKCINMARGRVPRRNIGLGRGQDAASQARGAAGVHVAAAGGGPKTPC